MDRSSAAPDLSPLLRAVAEPQRLCLLRELADGSRAVHELVDASGLAQASVSRHLGVLREAGLVESRRRGRSRRYAWARPSAGSPAAGLLAWLRRSWAAGRAGGATTAPEQGRSAGPSAPELEDHLL